MYNRYIPEDTSYTRVERELQERPPRPHHGGGERRQSKPAGRAASAPAGLDGLAALLGGKDRNGLSGVFKRLHLDNIDTGDVLLLLIILFLLVEGDDLELVIALGLVLLMGLGDEEKTD